jgi:hypothetical protein
MEASVANIRCRLARAMWLMTTAAAHLCGISTQGAKLSSRVDQSDVDSTQARIAAVRIGLLIDLKERRV